MIVLDASVLIAHLDASDNHHSRAESLLDSAAAELLSASPITLAEVLTGPARNGTLDQVAAALNQLGVSSVPLAQDAPARLALLRAGTGLKLPDCCVLLAAEQTQGTVGTFDHRLAATALQRGVMLADE